MTPAKWTVQSYYSFLQIDLIINNVLNIIHSFRINYIVHNTGFYGIKYVVYYKGLYRINYIL